MKIGTCAKLLLAAAPLLTGCAGFWDAPSSSTSFALTNSGNIAVSPGSYNTATITVTPSNSFTGTVSLTCAVTTTLSNATSPTTCSLSPTSVAISSTGAQTSTLTATTTATTTTGTYDIKVTGVSGSITESTTVCAEVTSASASCSVASGTSGIFYVLNQTTNQIVAYYVKAGTLTMIGSYTTPATPVTLTVAPDDSFLYLSTANGIYLYNIGSDGALTLENSSSAISSDMAQAMQVDSTNTWLVESVSGLSEVYAIPISASTGLPSSHTEQYAVLPSTNIQQLTISPDNSYVFVAMGTGGTAVIPFTAGNTNPFGTVGNIPVKNSSGAALSVAVDPTDRLFYIGETNATSATNSGGLRVFKYSSLPSVAELSASPYASQGLAPYSIVPISTGGYVYVVNRQVSGSSTGVIAGYAIASSGSTYTLTALGSTFAAGTHPEAMVEDSTDQFLFVVNYGGSYDLMGYTFDSTNAGYLDSAVSSTTGTDPVGASAIAAIH